MKGWTIDGQEIELTRRQEEVVLGILRWDEANASYVLPMAGRGYGKTTILATVAEYTRRRHAGVAVEDLR